MTKLAFVVPWYGPKIPGGAEFLTRGIVRHLHAEGYDLEVITTCIRDFYGDWAQNYYAAGLQSVEGIPVRRFPVEARDRRRFDEVNLKLMHALPITAAEACVYINELFRCPSLYAYLEQHQNEYLFFFIPYMFPTTYHGGKICPTRSVIIPCLHDESYAYLDLYTEVIPRARALIFLAEAEMALARRIYELPADQIQTVIGTGVDADFEADGARFRAKHNLQVPFVLYVGRREPGKNVPLLLRYWQRYVQRDGGQGKLVLIGSGEVDIPAGMEDHILDLGFVPLQDKYDAFAAADVVCQPSVNESFSFVIMESWLAGTPVLVHADCAVTLEHCRKSNGGLYFANYAEFAATVTYLFEETAVAQQLARQGEAYVRANFEWPHIMRQYRQLIGRILDES